MSYRKETGVISKALWPAKYAQIAFDAGQSSKTYTYSLGGHRVVAGQLVVVPVKAAGKIQYKVVMVRSVSNSTQFVGPISSIYGVIDTTPTPTMPTPVVDETYDKVSKSLWLFLAFSLGGLANAAYFKLWELFL